MADDAAIPALASVTSSEGEAAAVAPAAITAAGTKPVGAARVRTDRDSASTATTADAADAAGATVSTDPATASATAVDPAAGGVVPPAQGNTRAEDASDTGETNRSASATAAVAAAPGQDKSGAAKGGRAGRESRSEVAAVGGVTNLVAPAPARLASNSAASEAAATLAAASTTPAEVADQLVTATHRFQGLDGTHHVTLELNPHGLGNVAIDVTIDGTTVHLRMAAEHAATGDLLRSSLDELRSSLEKGGFTAGQFDVGQQRSGQQPQQRQAAPGFDELWRGDRQASNRPLNSIPQAADRLRPTRTRTDRRVDIAL